MSDDKVTVGDENSWMELHVGDEKRGRVWLLFANIGVIALAVEATAWWMKLFLYALAFVGIYMWDSMVVTKMREETALVKMLTRYVKDV